MGGQLVVLPVAQASAGKETELEQALREAAGPPDINEMRPLA